MKKIFFVIVILSLIFSFTSQTQNDSSQSCDQLVFAEDIQSKVSLGSDKIMIGSQLHHRLFYQNDEWGWTQEKFKSYILKQDSSTTKLLIRNISLSDGSEEFNRFNSFISNTYEVVDTDGPLVLLKETVGQSVFLTLHGYNFNRIVKWGSYDITSKINDIIIKKVIYLDNGAGLVNDIYALVPILSVSDKVLSLFPVYYSSGKFDTETPFYVCKIKNINSALYSNHGLTLQIDGNNLYNYLNWIPSDTSGYDVPTDTNFTIYYPAQFNYNTSLYTNYKVLRRPVGFNMAMWTDDLSKASIFSLIPLGNGHMTTSNEFSFSTSNPNQIKILTDNNALILLVNIQSSQLVALINVEFQKVFENGPTDQGNTQLISDFANTQALSFGFYTNNYYFFLYSPSKIIKYTVSEARHNDGTSTISWTKNFDAQLRDSAISSLDIFGENFEITLNKSCLCPQIQIEDLVCFYTSDNCVFTVSTVYKECMP